MLLVVYKSSELHFYSLLTYKNPECNTVAAKCFEGEESMIARPGDQELDRTSILCYTVCIRETM